MQVAQKSSGATQKVSNCSINQHQCTHPIMDTIIMANIVTNIMATIMITAMANTMTNIMSTIITTIMANSNTNILKFMFRYL